MTGDPVESLAALEDDTAGVETVGEPAPRGRPGHDASQPVGRSRIAGENDPVKNA